MWRRLLLVLGSIVLGVLVVRATIIAVSIPYAIWVGYRESGYPWWIYVPLVMIVIGCFAYLIRRGTFDRRWPR